MSQAKPGVARPLLPFTFLLLVAVAGVRGQEDPAADRRPDEATRQTTADRCTSGGCEIVLEHVVTLKDNSDAPIISDASPLVVRDRVGRYLLVASGFRRLALFSAEGQFLRLLATPPDFRMVSVLLASPAGHVSAYDQVTRLLTVFDKDLRPERAIQIGYAPTLIDDDGTFLIAGQVRTPDLVGYPLHFVDRLGRVIRSFGTERPESRPETRLFSDKAIAPAAKGGIWAVSKGRYVIERWDPRSGKQLAQLIVRSEWFAESGALPENRSVRPLPIIQAIWERDALLWLLIRAADQRWKPPRDPDSERPWNRAEINATYDWLVEAVDPATGRVVASKRLDAIHWGRSPQPWLVSRGSAETGAPNIAELSIPILRRDDGHGTQDH